MPQTITIIGYTINELKPEIQDKVVDKYSEINTDYDWYDSLYDGFHEMLEEHGLECKDFTWDIYRNDFGFSKLYLNDKDKLFEKLDMFKVLIPLELQTGGKYEMEITVEDPYVNIYLSDEDENTITTEEAREYETIIESKIEELREELENKCLKILKDEYEYLTSRELIIDTLEANEYLFTAEGERI